MFEAERSVISQLAINKLPNRKLIMFLSFGNPRNLSELKSVETKPMSKQRSGIPVVVIDDEDFEYLELLRKHDFHIRLLNDIDDIKAVSEYAIVICDIKGVGKSFGSKFEGAHVISEVKKRYTEKILIAYTGQQFDASFNQYFQLCDFVLKKDIDSDDWIEKLDSAIQKSLDPIHQWHRMRNYLLANDVPLFTVFRLEQEYIDSLISRKYHFPRKRTLESLSGDVKAVILNFTSSILFKLIIG